MVISYMFCYLFDWTLSLSYPRSLRQVSIEQSSTMKCAVHFYDMLHSFGKAKHIFISRIYSPLLFFHIPSSFLSFQFHIIFSLCFAECHCRSAFHFFAVHFVVTSVSFFCSLSLCISFCLCVCI